MLDLSCAKSVEIENIRRKRKACGLRKIELDFGVPHRSNPIMLIWSGFSHAVPYKICVSQVIKANHYNWKLTVQRLVTISKIQTISL